MAWPSSLSTILEEVIACCINVLIARESPGFVPGPYAKDNRTDFASISLVLFIVATIASPVLLPSM
jgi:hypothetical protein